MTTRTQRRAEERKRKKALKPMAVDPTQAVDPTKTMDAPKVTPAPWNPAPASSVSGNSHCNPQKVEAVATTEQYRFVQDSPKPAPSPAQRAANQQNASHSTGPRTAEGKAASSRNRRTHGLTADMFHLLSYESQDEYNALEAEFLAEYAPASLTETLLVRKMIQSWWLRQRAQLMTDMTIPGSGAVNAIELLPLYMRYQAHHDRAFHKTLNDLRKLRAETRRQEAARQKSEQVEILFAQKAEYLRLRTHALRSKLTNQEHKAGKPTPPSEIGFVSQPASQPPNATPTDAETFAQEAAA